MPETKNTVTKEKMLLMNSLVDWTQQRKGSLSIGCLNRNFQNSQAKTGKNETAEQSIKNYETTTNNWNTRRKRKTELKKYLKQQYQTSEGLRKNIQKEARERRKTKQKKPFLQRSKDQNYI